MGMLKSITLENYKCFRDETKIDIAPLTVLCGVNSSGKSSILKSLLMLKQSYENNSNLNSISLNGKYTNNGFFSNIANIKDKPIKLKNTFEFDKTPFMTSQEKIFLKDLNDIYGLKGEITKTSIEIILELDNQNRKNPSYGDNNINKISIIISNNIYRKKISIVFNLIEDLRYNIIISGLPCLKHEIVELRNTTCHFDGLKIVSLYFDCVVPEQNTDQILSNLFTISRIVSLQYKDINYISPLRSAPERRYIIEHDIENVGIYGEFVPQILEKYKTKNARINKLPENDLFTERYTPIKQKVYDATNMWLNYFGIDEYTINCERELLRLSIGAHNILDVGFGISQALPIIVSGITLPHHSTLLLEQPEVHLHPRMQMSMADLLIATSMAHKNVIFETHSDHIINRISRRMMENKYIRENVSIKFIDKDVEEKIIIEDIPVDPIRGIVTANENFFREFVCETEKILYAGFANKTGK